MPWLKLDDSMGEHRKTRRLLRKGGLPSFGLHTLAMLHASRYLTDGFIDAEYVEEILDSACVRGKTRIRAVQLLVDSGQWSECDGGWQLHDYLDHNPTRAAVLESRRKDSERKARGRRPDSARTDAGIQGESERPVPSRPVPQEPNGSSPEIDKASPDAIRLSHLLADLIRQRDPKAKCKPDGDTWLRAMRLLLADRDGDVAEVERVMRWARDQAFWQPHILSPAKLRDKFTTLFTQSAAGANVTPIRPGVDPEYEALRERRAAAMERELERSQGVVA